MWHTRRQPQPNARPHKIQYLGPCNDRPPLNIGAYVINIVKLGVYLFKKYKRGYVDNI